MAAVCKNMSATKLPPVTDGPGKALDKLLLQLSDADARRAWAEKARIQAIVGSCARSTSSTKTGIRHWVKFAKEVLRLPRPYPAPVWGLQAWSQIFRWALPRLLSVASNMRCCYQVCRDVFELQKLCANWVFTGT